MDTEAFGKKALPILQKAGVKKAAFFGSFARGEATGASDVDIVVELDHTKSLFDLAELKLQIEEELKRKVDITTYHSLHPFLKEKIIQDAISIL